MSDVDNRPAEAPVVEPAQVWLDKARSANDNLQESLRRIGPQAQWRKECIQMAVAMGATHNQVAEALKMSRSKVTRLVNGE